MSAGVTLDAVFYGEKLRDAQRHFYETLEGGSGGTSSTKSGRLAGTLSRVSGEVQPEQAIPGSVPNVESVSPRTSLQARAASAKRQGYGADGEISPKERHRESSEVSPLSARTPRGSVASLSGAMSRLASRASVLSTKTETEEEPPRSARASASRASYASIASTQMSEASPRSARSSKANLESFRYGPERFFYDSRTYTGVHKNGGPTNVDVRDVETPRSESQVSPRKSVGSATARSRAWSTMSSRSNMLDDA